MKKLLFLLLPFLLFAVSKNNIFAITWMDGFCEVNHHKKSCKFRKYNDYSHTHFTIHGLWPKHKNYCHYKKMDLDKEFLKELNIYMPGALDGFAKYEWRKHGTCFGSDAKEYFLTQIKLLKEFNHSKIRDYFAKHKGEYITLSKLRLMFKKEFNSPRKFQLLCKKGYVVEIRMNLYGNPIRENLKELLKNADEMIGKRNCQRGLIE